MIEDLPHPPSPQMVMLMRCGWSAIFASAGCVCVRDGEGRRCVLCTGVTIAGSVSQLRDRNCVDNSREGFW